MFKWRPSISHYVNFNGRNHCNSIKSYQLMNTLRINWCKFYVVTNTTNIARFKSLCFVSMCGGGVAYITHMPGRERWLENPSKRDLKLVGHKAGQWGTESKAKGEQRWVCCWTKRGPGWINPLICRALVPGVGNQLNYWPKVWVKHHKPYWLYHLTEIDL